MSVLISEALRIARQPQTPVSFLGPELDSMDPQSASPLALLPVELLLRITRSLNTETFGSLRLSCKRIERSLFHFFSREFFAKKQFMISDESLQALIDISQHEALSPVLRHVIVGLDKVDSSTIVEFSSDEQAMRFATASVRQFSLISTGAATDMLKTAFKGLKNLSTVDIRDFNAPSRYRDGPNCQWSSFGSTTLHRETGINFMGNAPDRSYPSTVFSIVLASLAQAESYPESIEVILRNRRWGLGDCAFDLTPRGSTDPAKVVSRLQKLHLDIDSVAQNAAMFRTAPTNYKILTSHHLGKLLSQAHNLTWLRINFQEGFLAGCDPFVSLFGQSRLVGSPPPLSKLERLDLGNATVPLPALAGVAARFPSLDALNLWKITIYDEHSPHPQPNLWPKLLRQVAKTSSLKRISVGHATQRTGGRLRLPVTFNGKQTFHLAGQSVNEALENMADGAAFVLPPDDDDSVSEDGGDGVEDGDDDGGDNNNNNDDGESTEEE